RGEPSHDRSPAGRPGPGERHAGAAPRRALAREVPAHHLPEALANAEARAGAAIFAGGGGIGLREFLEQLAHLLRRHAYTGVGDRNGKPAILLPWPGFNRDGAVIGELVGIAHEV